MISWMIWMMKTMRRIRRSDEGKGRPRWALAGSRPFGGNSQCIQDFTGARTAPTPPRAPVCPCFEGKPWDVLKPMGGMRGKAPSGWDNSCPSATKECWTWKTHFQHPGIHLVGGCRCSCSFPKWGRAAKDPKGCFVFQAHPAAIPDYSHCVAVSDRAVSVSSTQELFGAQVFLKFGLFPLFPSSSHPRAKASVGLGRSWMRRSWKTGINPMLATVSMESRECWLGGSIGVSIGIWA